MATTPKELYERAMSLTDTDRAELVGLLLETLEIESDSGAEAAWLKEIDRRVAELDSGAVTTVSWSEVKSRVFRPRAD